MNKTELDEILRLHALWFRGEPSGIKADLRGSDLRDADLRDADLRGSDLSCSDLRGSDLSDAHLSYADLSGANLSGADLRRSDLSGANLSYADLSGANLSGADLRYASLSCADLSGADTGTARFIQASGVGSARRMTTYRADTDEVWCGCFKGTLAVFADKIEETHKENPVHLAHYRAMVVFFKVFAEVK